MTLRDSIARCKAALPLPELWHKLGCQGEPKRCCRSPFRDDKNESFSVFQREGLWFWKDHAQSIAGDEVDFIEQHAGIEKTAAIKSYHDLAGIQMPEKAVSTEFRKSTLGKIVKVYDYRNANGQLVHQTVRYEPKNFRQRRPAEKGMVAGNRRAWCDSKTNEWWISTLEGIEPVLYRLPALLAADPSVPVFLCEGEKDADAIVARGGVATTAPMGAGKWRKSYTETLKGRSVIIVSDMDVAGQNHAELVAGKLKEVCPVVKVTRWGKLAALIQWPTGKKLDAHDYITARPRPAAAA